MIQKINAFIFSAFIYSISATLVFAQSAALLPNALQQFFDANGNPLSSGTVGFYFPSTLNLKPIWQDAGEATPYTNPVTLNAAGEPPSATGIYGQGAYRQIVKDILGNTIWDAVTSSTGAGGGTAATGDGDLVGTIKPWAGLLAPSQYMFAYGEQLSRTTFASLFTAITLSTNVVCTSASNTLSGIVDTTSIPIGAPIEVTCVAPGTIVSSKTASTVVMSNPSSVSLTTVAVFFPFGNGDGTTTFTLPDLRGNVVAGRPNMGGTASTNLTATYFGSSPLALNAVGGSQHDTFTVPQTALQAFTLPNTLGVNIQGYTNSGTNPDIVISNGGSVNGVATGGAINNVPQSASNAPASSFVFNVTGGVQSGGTNVPLDQPTVQPTITLNYIIKVTPDANSAIANGVTSLGGMTGSIACGTGLICTGNNVSVSQAGGTVNTGLANQLAYYGSNGVVLSGLATTNNNVLTTNGSGVPTWLSTLPCLNHPALTGNITSSAGSCATTLAVQAPGLAFVGNTLNVAASKIYNITLAPYSAPCNYNAVSDGAMGSGSTTLTSATANFSVGDVGKYIAVGGAASAGANLFTTVATFVNSTTVTLTSGNASGGAVSGKFVEYGNDDTTAIQAAFNAAAVAGGTVYIPAGKRCLLSRLNATNTSISIDIRGDGVNSSALFPLQVASYGTSSGHMIDLTGSAFIRLKDFQIGAFYELAAPTTAIMMAQVASGVSNRMLCDGMYISGQFTLSTFYNYGVPSSECRHSDFYNYRAGAGSQDVLRFSATNGGSVTSSFATVTTGTQSTSDWLFTDNEFHKFAGAGANNDVITLDGVTNINFVGGVVSGGATTYVNFANSSSSLNFIGVTFETESQPVTPTNAYTIPGGATLTGLSTMQSSYILTGSAVFNIAGTLTVANTQVQVLAVASLPTCNAAAEGSIYGVNNSNSTTFNATVAGGGANHVMVYCNASNWVIGG